MRLKKIPTEIFRACTQVKAEAEPLLYQGNKLSLRPSRYLMSLPSEKLSLLENASLYDVFPWMHFHNRLGILKISCGSWPANTPSGIILNGG